MSTTPTPTAPEIKKATLIAYTGLAFLPVILVLVAVTMFGNIDAYGTINAAQTMGLKQVQIVGKAAPWDCVGYYRTRFIALNHHGEKVTGAVCQAHEFFGLVNDTQPRVKLRKPRVS